jgi:hypothetical protein
VPADDPDASATPSRYPIAPAAQSAELPSAPDVPVWAWRAPAPVPPPVMAPEPAQAEPPPALSSSGEARHARRPEAS